MSSGMPRHNIMDENDRVHALRGIMSAFFCNIFAVSPSNL